MDHPRLTAAELRVFQLIAQGLSCKEIANALGVSEITVRTHRQSLQRKFESFSIEAITVMAIEHARDIGCCSGDISSKR